MRHLAGALIAVFLVALPASAVDLGRAEGGLMIDGTKIVLNYAYAIGKQKNQLTDRNEMTRIILTDRPLPDGAKLSDLDDSLPGDLNGVIISVDIPPVTTTADTSREFRTMSSSRAAERPERLAASFHHSV